MLKICITIPIIIPILEKELTHVILQIGTNDTIKSSYQKFFDDLLKLKLFITDKLSSCLVTISMPVKRKKHHKSIYYTKTC